jgi:putative transposase
MPRRPRLGTGGLVYHVLNRGVARIRLFDEEGDYAAFERGLEETLQRLPMRLLAYCLMPNHWHLVLWPRHDGDLSQFMRLLTVTHTQRWHAQHHSGGTGPIYQGRFKSFPAQSDAHLLVVLRYVERHPRRANLPEVARAADWRWSSLGRAQREGGACRIVSAWPIARPRNWPDRVDRPETEAELEALRASVRRGRPFGESVWVRRTAARLGLEASLRPIGRPKKEPEEKLA